jgi:GNAT superfamily N-acetyltransferase
MEVAVYVSAPHRGAGLGRHLVDRAIEVSRALGARRFLCFPWSERGRALFRAAGAVPTGSGGKWIVEL